MVAGVKVASQTPAIRSGQRIIFLTLDDATGPVEVTVFESVQPKVREDRLPLATPWRCGASCDGPA